MDLTLVFTFLAVMAIAFVAACQPSPHSEGGLTQAFTAEMPVAGSIVFTSK